MRRVLMQELYRAAQRDSGIMLLVGDLGFSVVEDFARDFPTQFMNLGIAEQAMTGVAAGMSLIGDRTIFTYSIGNFTTLRCLEQIRNDICVHNANVKIVSLGGGMQYGAQGYTHFSVEDLAILRALPGIIVAAPSDMEETKQIVRLAIKTPGPWYIRIASQSEVVDIPRDDLQIGGYTVLRKGRDGTILATGAIAYEALKASHALEKDGLSVAVISLPFVTPLSGEVIQDAAKRGWLASLEEHVSTGGFGSAIAEYICDNNLSTRLIRLAIRDPLSKVGSHKYLKAYHEVDSEGIRRRLLDALRSGGGKAGHE